MKSRAPERPYSKDLWRNPLDADKIIEEYSEYAKRLNPMSGCELHDS